MADKRLPELTNTLSSPDANDLIHVVDVSNTSEAASGTSTKSTLQILANWLATLTQTLTNKTLTSPKINENVSVTTSATELNFVDGVTSAIQTQFNAITAMFNSTGLELTQISTPANPASGKNLIYTKTNNKAYVLTSAGVETQVGGGAQTEVFIIAGTFPSAATTNLSKTWYAPAAVTLSAVSLYVDTAGSGTGSTVVDINKNGTTITTNKLTLTTTFTSHVDVTPTTTAVAKGDAITIDVDSVTATTAPSNGYVLIHYTRD